MATPTLVTINGTLAPVLEATTVRFRIPTPIRSGSGPDVLLPSVIETSVAVDGTFTVQVPGTNDPGWSPTNWTYEVSVIGDNLEYSFFAQVPYNAGTLNFSALLPAAAASDGTLYAAFAHTHSAYVSKTGDTISGDLTIQGVLSVASGGTSINAVDRAAITNFAAYVLRTAGVDRWSMQMINNSTHDLRVSDSANGTTALLAEARATMSNLSLLTSTKSYGNGVGVIFIPNANTIPNANPAGGGLLYDQAGALMYRGSGGTVTQIAPA